MKTIIGIFLLVMLATSCRKSIPHGNLEQGEIALTFDDASVENWVSYLPLLDSLNIKATFYISKYHTFNTHKKEALRQIERRGHEIAYHTAHHLDLAKEAAKNGTAKMEEKEINTDLRLMRADGFILTDFAYPYGSHTTQLNTCLLRTFKSVRALSSQGNYYKSLVKESGERQVLYGANIDNNSRLNDEGILKLMTDAQEHNDCLVLVAHEINNPSIKLQVSRQRLLKIAEVAKEKRLTFITVNQIAK